MEKKLSFDAVFGGTEEQQRALRAKSEAEAQQDGFELFGEEVVEPTAAEKAAIDTAVEFANKIAAKYGASKAVDSARIFLLNSGGVGRENKGGMRQGVCDFFNQSIGVDRSASVAIMATTVVHECLHLASYSAMRISQDDSFVYRSGIEVMGRQGDDTYFAQAQEAIIETCNDEFVSEVIARDPLYKKEYAETQEIKEWLTTYVSRNFSNEIAKAKSLRTIKYIRLLPDTATIIECLQNETVTDHVKFDTIMDYYQAEIQNNEIFMPRVIERETFNKVLDEIMSGSQGKITDKKALFAEFAKAHFSGKYLPLARLIEGALGEGSFRRIAAELAAKPVLEDEIEAAAQSETAE